MKNYIKITIILLFVTIAHNMSLKSQNLTCNGCINEMNPHESETHYEWLEINYGDGRDWYDTYWVGIIFGNEEQATRPRIATKHDDNNDNRVGDGYNELSFLVNETVQMEVDKQGLKVHGRTKVNETGWGITQTDGAREIGFFVRDGLGGVIGTKSDHDLRLVTSDDDEGVILKTNGNFGIGTTTPSVKLEVKGKTKVNETGWGITQTDGTREVGFFVRDGLGGVIGTKSDHDLRLVTSNDNKGVILKTNGSFGIGTTTPSEKLEINGGNVMVDSDRVKKFIGNTIDSSAGFIGTLSNHGLVLGTNSTGNNIFLDTDNSVYIGGVSASNTKKELKLKYSLFVKDGILTEDIAIAKVQFWSDYVFDDNYKLKPLKEVNSFIKKNKHLPNIPSQKTIKEEGYNMHTMNARFLEKIEELTLYTIEQQKLIEDLKKDVETLKKLSKKDLQD